MHELLIVGAGPAGLSAAIYAARAGVTVTVLERLAAGGQVAETSEVENYPGFVTVGGQELASKMREQAEHQGATFVNGNLRSLHRDDRLWTATLTSGETMSAGAVVAASGASRRKLDVPGEKELAGAGVSYCATCDGGFFKGLAVAVVGGGSVAFEDALYLSRICQKVYLIHRREGFRAERRLIEHATATENIEFLLNRTVDSVDGNGMVEGVTLKDTGSGDSTSLAVDGLFVAVGTTPNTEWLDGHVALDRHGYALVDETCDAGNGLYVAGDLRQKPIYQIVSAVSDGAVAATAAARFLQQA